LLKTQVVVYTVGLAKNLSSKDYRLLALNFRPHMDIDMLAGS
jgi:hypothetical protein